MYGKTNLTDVCYSDMNCLPLFRNALNLIKTNLTDICYSISISGQNIVYRHMR